MIFPYKKSKFPPFKTVFHILNNCHEISHFSHLKDLCHPNTNQSQIDRSERHEFLFQFLLIHSPFFFHIFKEGREKGKRSYQSRGQNSCLSDRSVKYHTLHIDTYFFNLKI